ncbi:hypothetical protein [Thalassococcus sp. S3]|uniref:hypothetical protein n=1 Tax=Thalassococcus sp. S3 TaxID=2017482 RepID=UPI0010247688|nr:hypothetical protein [Thalassococcus sp. S3]QBF30366.1 hypothetical protein CFI11_03930 [Thalassococcus sp. S3]
MIRLAAILLAVAFALPLRTAEPRLCDGSVPALAGACDVIETYCLPYLEDPTTLKPDDLKPVPRYLVRHFEGQLSTYLLGYRVAEGYDKTAVLYMFDEPACEIVTFDVGYAELLHAYEDWRAGPGRTFAATGEFEPVSRLTMDRAYAATFLAAPRQDGRVTEITFNWNLSFAGVTRLRLSYQPLRDHTRDLMQREMK